MDEGAAHLSIRKGKDIEAGLSAISLDDLDKRHAVG